MPIIGTKPPRRGLIFSGSKFKVSVTRLSVEQEQEQFHRRPSRNSQTSALSFRYEWTPGLHDNADFSLHPSYNIVITDCADLYREAKDKYHKQFQREMKHLIASQPNIREQCNLRRILCYKTSWPPLHTKRELNNFVTKFFQLTPRQRKRVDYLMETDLS